MTGPETFAPFLAALQGSLLVLSDERPISGDGWFASVELCADTPPRAGQSPADAILEAYCDLLEPLGGHARAIWDGCSRKSFNLGFESWGAPPRGSICQEQRIAADTVARIAALRGCITVSVYAVPMARRRSIHTSTTR